jgi:3-oxoacyl-[acyl-carrier protein] reductase
MTSTPPLTGKIALVTGGSRGIGAAIVKRLAADGATVALTYASRRDKADEVVAAIEAEAAERWPSRPTAPMSKPFARR